MPVANGSRNGTPTNPALASIDVEPAVMAGPVTYGTINVDKNLNNTGTGYPGRGTIPVRQDPRLQSANSALTALGCFLHRRPGAGHLHRLHSLNPNPNLPISRTADLNAGSSFSVKAPNGSPGNPGEFRATLSTAGTFLVPGAYAVTGTGGADVGPFSATITIPASPALVSPLNSTNLTVTRSSGMTVTWKGGGPNGNVQIQVAGATDNTLTLGDTAQCTVPASAGTFTIPSYVLLALPPTAFTSFQFAPVTATVPFHGNGSHCGLLSTYDDATIFSGFALK
jgi:hypothetical protein